MNESRPQIWGACENVFSNSALFLKQQKFRTQNALAFCEQLNILKETSSLSWAVQSMLGLLSFSGIGNAGR